MRKALESQVDFEKPERALTNPIGSGQSPDEIRITFVAIQILIHSYVDLYILICIYAPPAAVPHCLYE